MRKASRKTLCRKADKLWSKIVLLKGQCEVCGSRRALNPHHVVGRRNLTLRHDPRNGVCLCSLHHTFGRESAHQDPVWFLYWLTEHRPDDYNYLIERREVMALNIDYEQVMKELEKWLSGLEKRPIHRN